MTVVSAVTGPNCQRLCGVMMCIATAKPIFIYTFIYTDTTDTTDATVLKSTGYGRVGMIGTDTCRHKVAAAGAHSCTGIPNTGDHLRLLAQPDLLLAA